MGPLPSASHRGPMKPLPIAPLALALASLAPAQGDTCTTGTLIASVGSFPFDNTLASTSQFTGNGNCSPAGPILENDVFWQWLAPQAGSYRLEARGTFLRPGIQLHGGTGCNARCLTFEGAQGAQNFAVLFLNDIPAGEPILIQVGSLAGQPGPGTLEIEIYDPCPGLAADGFEENDTCQTPAPLWPGTVGDLTIDRADPDFYALTIPPRTELWLFENQDEVGVDYHLWNPGCQGTALTSGPSFVIFPNIDFAPKTVILEARVSPFSPGQCGRYGLDVSFVQNPCTAIPDDPFEENDTCQSPVPLPPGNYPGLHCKDIDPDFYYIVLEPGQQLQITDLSVTPLVEYRLWNQPCMQVLATPSARTLNHTNSTASTQTTILEAFYNPGFVTCAEYWLDVRVLSGAGVPFCDPMDPNSSGRSTRMTGTLGSGSGSDLLLESEEGPPGQFGYFLVGTGISEPGIQISDGRLCLSLASPNAIGRYNLSGTIHNSLGQFDGAGRFQNLSQTSQSGYGFEVPETIPIAGSPMVQAGSTWYFQAWHREPGGRSNFSNGLQVTF